MARFQVGQIVIGFTFIIRNRNGNELLTPSNPFGQERTGIKLVMLECVEYHKVPTLYDESNISDGYIFKDENGNIYHNQYPHAEYGQISTEQDWLFLEINIKQMALYKYFNNYIEHLLRYIYKETRIVNSNESSSRDIEYLKALREEFLTMTSLYKEFTGDKVKFKPREFKTTDGGVRRPKGFFRMMNV
jgi:hypothetical protein